MKKIISILLTLAMAISVCSNVVLAADTQARVDAITSEYSELTQNATLTKSLIYVDDSIDEGFTFSPKDFLGTGRDIWEFVAVSYPPTLKESADSLTGINKAATITQKNGAYTLKSDKTGITYKLPAKKDHSASAAGAQLAGEEAIVIDAGANSFEAQKYSKQYAWDINNGSYDKIYILVGTTYSENDKVQDSDDAVIKDDASDYCTLGWTRTGALSVIPWYFGANDINEAVAQCGLADQYKGNGNLTFKTALLESAAANGSNGYLGRIFPTLDQLKAGENTGNLLGELEVRSCMTTTPEITGAERGKATPYTGTFAEDSTNSMLVYEYCLDVDEAKTLKEVRFTLQYGGQKKGMTILGIVGQTGTAATPFYKDLLSDEDLEDDAAKIYVDPTDPSETTATYNKRNFLGRGLVRGNEFVAIKWPLQAVATKSAGLPAADKATITIDTKGTDSKKDDVSIVKSARSGMTYELTRDTDGLKDAVLLCPRRAEDGKAKEVENYLLPRTATIPVHNAPYETISVLGATALQAFNGKDKLKIYVNYTDGTNSFALNSGENYSNSTKYVTKGFHYGSIPHYDTTYGTGSAHGQDNWYLAELQTMIFKTSDGNTYRNPNDPSVNPADVPMSFTEPGSVTVTNGTKTAVEGPGIMFEITLSGLDTTKTVESVTVETYVIDDLIGTDIDDAGTKSYKGARGCAILGVAGQQAVVANPADVDEDEVAIKAYTKIAGDVYAAVYEKNTKKLVAMGLAEDVAASTAADIAVNNDSIAANGNYDIKLFVWATDGSFAPLAGAANVNIAQ